MWKKLYRLTVPLLLLLRLRFDHCCSEEAFTEWLMISWASSFKAVLSGEHTAKRWISHTDIFLTISDTTHTDYYTFTPFYGSLQFDGQLIMFLWLFIVFSPLKVDPRGQFIGFSPLEGQPRGSSASFYAVFSTEGHLQWLFDVSTGSCTRCFLFFFSFTPSAFRLCRLLWQFDRTCTKLSLANISYLGKMHLSSVFLALLSPHLHLFSSLFLVFGHIKTSKSRTLNNTSRKTPCISQTECICHQETALLLEMVI